MNCVSGNIYLVETRDQALLNAVQSLMIRSDGKTVSKEKTTA